jgi:hypothetical protein
LAVTSFDRAAQIERFFVDVIDPSGGQRRSITESAASSPVWSPDGGRLAFLAYQPGAQAGSSPLTVGVPAIEVYDVERGAGQMLRLEVEPRSLPVWTPDGEYLVFSATVSGQPGRDLYMVRPDGSGLERLTATEAFEMTPGRWSADGQWLTVGVNDWDYSAEAQAEICADPCWGRLEVFHWGQREFVVPLEHVAIYCEHQWSPEGASLAFLDYCTEPQEPPRDIYVWDAASMTTQRLTTYEPGHLNMLWGVEDFAWVDDGTMYFTRWDIPDPLYELDVATRATRFLQEGYGLPFDVRRDGQGHLWLVVGKGIGVTDSPVPRGTQVFRDGELVYEDPVPYEWVFAPGAVALAAIDRVQTDPYLDRLIVLSGLERGSPERLELEFTQPLGRLIWAPAVGTPVIAWWWIGLGVVAVLAGGVAAWLIRRKRSRHDVPRWSPQP